MATADLIAKSFSQGFNRLLQLWEDDKLQESLDGAQKLLEEPDIPRYFRIKTLILIASSVEEWHDAQICIAQAEALWGASRHYHAVGQNEDVDDALTELRKSLDSLKEALGRGDTEESVEDMVEFEKIQTATQVEEDKELAKAEADDPVEV